jgi:hypothetical protein
MMQWNKDVLLIQDHKNAKHNYTTTKDAFTLFVRRELDELETFIDREVLFGISLESIGVSCRLTDSMDTGDKTTPGYGPFLSADNTTLDNVDSNKFLRALINSERNRLSRRLVAVLYGTKQKAASGR